MPLHPAEAPLTWLESAQQFMTDLAAFWPIKFGVSAIGSVTLALFGAWRESYQALLILMLVDLVTGVWAAARHREFKAAVMRQKSVVKWCGYALVIVAANQIELAVRGAGLNFASTYSLGAALVYLCATEFLSVIENYERITGKRVRPWAAREALARLGVRAEALERRTEKETVALEVALADERKQERDDAREEGRKAGRAEARKGGRDAN